MTPEIAKLGPPVRAKRVPVVFAAKTLAGTKAGARVEPTWRPRGGSAAEAEQSGRSVLSGAARQLLRLIGALADSTQLLGCVTSPATD